MDLAELKAQMRRERRAVRSLENELALLRARLRDAPPAPPPPAPPPPVEERASELPEVEPALDDTLGGSQWDHEVEVIYEGEAAEGRSTRVRLELEETTRSYRGREPIDSPRRRIAVPETPARLGVVRERLPKVANQLRHARAPAALARSVGGSEPADSRSEPVDPRTEYQRILAALRAGNHEHADAGLRSWLDRFPRHELADNAQYWLAESYYARRNVSLALVEFEKVLDRYPNGNKIPDALLKIAYCQLKLGRRAAARANLEKVVTSHPKSRPAALARAKLQELEP